VADGSQPPLCHIHAAIARGQASSPLTEPIDDIDEVKILKRLARDSNPQVRLRAVDLLLEVKRKNKEKAEDGPAGPTPRQFLDALTPEERTAVQSLVTQLREIQKVVYARAPKLRPITWPPEDSTIRVADLVPDAAPPARAEHTTAAPPTPEDENYLVIEE
jgi:hypothetical protein